MRRLLAGNKEQCADFTLGLFKEIFSLPMRVVVHFKTSEERRKEKKKIQKIQKVQKKKKTKK